MKTEFKQKLNKIANKMGWKLSDNCDEIIDNIILKGYECPCRIDHTPCPCKYVVEDVATKGSCHCGLFVK